MKSIKYTVIMFLLSGVVLGNTYFLDPTNGALTKDGSISSPWGSLSEVVGANYIRSKQYSPLPYSANSQLVDKNLNGIINAGDTLILRGGLHGGIFLRNYINEIPIVIQTFPNETPILEKVQLQACKNWIFDGVEVSTEPYGYYLNNRLFFIETHDWQGPSSHITIQNCEIYSTTQPWTEAQDWVYKSSEGLFISGDSCKAVSNTIINIDMGLTCMGNYITAEENQIINFSGDGGRVLGSFISFNYNLIKNNYNVDDNHDDGIQSFTTNGYIVDHNTIIGNLIINSDDVNQPLSGPLQGIGCFDGFFNDWLIANNVISVNHWHGITLLGARRCTIIHNTVIDPTPTITPGGSWIRIDDHKDGTPSSDCLVANNVANQFNVAGEELTNYVLDSHSAYAENFKDFENFDFSLLSGSSLIDAADADFSVAHDITLNQRDILPDIGAYEYIGPTTSIADFDPTNEFIVYPNPFYQSLKITNLSDKDEIILCDMKGVKLFSGDLAFINRKLGMIPSGIYSLLIIRDKIIMETKKIYKTH